MKIRMVVEVDLNDFIEYSNGMGDELDVFSIESWDVKQNMEALLSTNFSDYLVTDVHIDKSDEDE